tara:strand:+ start:254 stop:406 length:153 start_codon:yes stop_codon:yes gene_type:complete
MTNGPFYEVVEEVHELCANALMRLCWWWHCIYVALRYTPFNIEIPLVKAW